MWLKEPKKKCFFSVLFFVLLILITGILAIIATYASLSNAPASVLVRADAVSITYQRSVYVLPDAGVQLQALINQQGRLGNSQRLLTEMLMPGDLVLNSLGRILPVITLTTSSFDNLTPNRFQIKKAILGRVTLKITESLPDYVASKFGYLQPIIQRNIHLLNGLEQAKFAWTSLNYFSKLIGNDLRKKTLNVVTLYGDDIYIAAELPNGVQNNIMQLCPRNLIKKETIYNNEFNLYTNTITCFGLYDVWVRLLARLMSGKTTPNIDNPCDQVGYVREIQTANVYGQRCVAGTEAETLFEIIYPRGTLEKYKFTGTGDYVQCKQEIEALFKDSIFAKCNKDLPKPEGEYAVFGVYNSFVDVKNYINKPIDPTDFRQTVQMQCSSTDQNVDLLTSAFCTEGVYLDELFKFLGFDDTTFQNLRFKKKVQEFELDFIVGDATVLLATKEFDNVAATYYFPKATFIPIIIVSLIAFIVCLIILIVLCYKHNTQDYMDNFTYQI